MHGMRSFTNYALAVAFMAIVVFSAFTYYTRELQYFIACFVSIIALAFCLYGSGYFNGWLQGHEEKRTIYRHEE